MRFPILVLAVFAVSASAVSFQADENLRIESPAADETVSGSVEIIGAAAAPGMVRYRVEFAYDPDPAGTWFLIAEGTEPVQDALLAVWDTSHISEGIYALRVAAYFQDGSIRDAVTHGIRVQRSLSATPVPSEAAGIPAGPDSLAYGRAAAAFPAPTAAVASELPSTSPPASSQGIAFWIGAGLAFLGFGLVWIRCRWLWWKHRQFIRIVRKSGG